MSALTAAQQRFLVATWGLTPPTSTLLVLGEIHGAGPKQWSGRVRGGVGRFDTTGRGIEHIVDGTRTLVIGWADVDAHRASLPRPVLSRLRALRGTWLDLDPARRGLGGIGDVFATRREEVRAELVAAIRAALPLADQHTWSPPPVGAGLVRPVPSWPRVGV